MSNHSEQTPSSGQVIGQTDNSPQDLQPESGFVDRQEQMDIRQSSPTNPRVTDKSEVNQEEA